MLNAHTRQASPALSRTHHRTTALRAGGHKCSVKVHSLVMGRTTQVWRAPKIPSLKCGVLLRYTPSSVACSQDTLPQVWRAPKIPSLKCGVLLRYTPSSVACSQDTLPQVWRAPKIPSLKCGVLPRYPPSSVACS